VAKGVDRVASVHTLKVTLCGVRPAVWRRLEVPSACTLGGLHEVLQDAFGRDGDHLHEFQVHGVRYAPRDCEPLGPSWLREPARNEDVSPLARVAPRVGDVLDYTYDLGADRRHRIEVEKVGPAAATGRYPQCTAGAGLAPEEGTGVVRPGRFDDSAREGLNALLRRRGAVVGRWLPADDPTIDPVFAGVLPGLTDEGPAECPCGCGASSAAGGAAGVLPALHPSPDVELAVLAADSVLVRRAVALATWIGTGRVLTPSQVLRPADAVRAVDELGLAVPLPAAVDDVAVGGVLPTTDDALRVREYHDPAGAAVNDRQDGRSGANDRSGPSEHLRSFEGGTDVAPAHPGPRTVRSAKDLPSLHPLWVGCVTAGLVEVRGGRAHPGPALAVWQEPAAPGARIESWAALLAGFLRARGDASRTDRRWLARGRGEVLQASVPLLFTLARDPVPAGLVTLVLAGLDGVPGPFGIPLLASELLAALEDWLTAGVVALAPGLEGEATQAVTERLDELRSQLDEHVAAVVPRTAGPEPVAELWEAMTAVLDGLVTGPVVRLTPLGTYGLGRLLSAHGWQVPVAGACVGAAPADLLDRLSAYLSEDAVSEAARWLEAQGDGWAEGVRQVIRTAAAQGEDGPPRRAVLPALLCAAGPRVAPLLDEVCSDQWLSAVVSAVRHALELGPGPTRSQRLWLAVDALCLLHDDGEDLDDAVAELGLEGLLGGSGAIATAVGLDHPRAHEMLWAVVPHLEDHELGRALRRALAAGSGHPERRTPGGPGHGGRGTGPLRPRRRR
jgi:hypothetical protein